MRASRCEKSEALARAFPRPPSGALAAHLAGCALCQAEWQSLQELRALGQELPSEQPTAERRDAVRARLLYEAERLRQASQGLPRSPSQVARRGFVALAAGLALGLLLLGLGTRALLPVHAPRPTTTQPSPALAPGHVVADRTAAILHPHGEADYQRTRQGGTEVVRLQQGHLELQVRHLAAGERFLVVVGGSEVEVRGTRFSVTAERAQLTAVQVLEGHVEVRPDAAPALQLHAGQGWTAASGTIHPLAARAGKTEGGHAERASLPSRARESEGVSSSGPAAASLNEARAADSTAGRATKPASSTRPSAADPVKPGRSAAPLGSPAERAFAGGFAALKLGQFAAAAADLDRAVTLSPGGSVAEDARFWASVAWARAGKSREAAQHLRSFLAHHPSSPRAAEVAAALGWILIRERRLDEAERVLRAASRQRSPEVSESIRSGLAAIASARTTP